MVSFQNELQSTFTPSHTRAQIWQSLGGLNEERSRYHISEMEVKCELNSEMGRISTIENSVGSIHHDTKREFRR